MRPTSQALTPIARARTLGGLVRQGEHAIAYAASGIDSLLAGFAQEGLDAGERVLILPGSSSTRAVAARLRAQGVGSPQGKPSALRIWDPSDIESFLAEFLQESTAQTLREGYEGLRVAHVCPAADLRKVPLLEARFPRQFERGLTLLCIYPSRSIHALGPDLGWNLAQFHRRILCL